NFITAAGDPYGGVLNNALELSLDYQISQHVWSKVNGGYDFRSLAPEPLQRMELVTFDLSADSPAAGSTAYVNGGFDPYWEDLQTLRQGVSFHDGEKWKFLLGFQFENRAKPPVSYYDLPGAAPLYTPQPNLFANLAQVAFPFPLLGRVSASYYYDLVNQVPIAQEITVNYPLHCWEAQFTWRQVPDINSL